MKITSLIIWMLLVNAASSDQGGGPPSVHVLGSNQSGPFPIRSTPESLADLLNRAEILITKSDFIRYQEGKEVADVKIRLMRPGKKNTYSFRIDPKSNELWNFQIQANDFVVISREPFGGVYFSVVLKLKKPVQGEQDGAGQPATAPESKSKGGAKPQPEAEGRSR